MLNNINILGDESQASVERDERNRWLDFLSPAPHREQEMKTVLDINEITSHQHRIVNDVAYLFNCFGEKKIRMYCVECGNEHIVTLHCGSRLCETCRKKSYGRILNEWLPRLESVPADRMVLMTLTRRIEKDIDLGKKIQETKKKFNQLVRQKLCVCVVGGMYVYEILLKESGWYVHMHILLEVAGVILPYRNKRGETKCEVRYSGQLLCMQTLSEAWKKLTGDSYIVDLTPVKGQENTLKYMLKYMFKTPVGLSVDNPDAVMDYQNALSKKRMVHAFGAWHKKHVNYRFADVVVRDKFLKCKQCGCPFFVSEFDNYWKDNGNEDDGQMAHSEIIMQFWEILGKGIYTYIYC